MSAAHDDNVDYEAETEKALAEMNAIIDAQHRELDERDRLDQEAQDRIDADNAWLDAFNAELEAENARFHDDGGDGAEQASSGRYGAVA